jgi:hypothetical protein
VTWGYLEQLLAKDEGQNLHHRLSFSPEAKNSTSGKKMFFTKEKNKI